VDEPPTPKIYEIQSTQLVRHDPQGGEQDTSIKDVAPDVQLHYSDNVSDNWGAEIKVYIHGRVVPTASQGGPLHLRPGDTGTAALGNITVSVTLEQYSASAVIVSGRVVESQ
jgi:hypothetical protein